MDDLKRWQQRLHGVADDTEMTEAFRGRMKAVLANAEALPVKPRARFRLARASTLAAGLLVSLGMFPAMATQGMVGATYAGPGIIPPLATSSFAQHDFTNATKVVGQKSEWVRFDGRIYVVTPTLASRVGTLLVRQPGLSIHPVEGHSPARELAIAYSAHNIRVARYAYPETVCYHQMCYQVQISSAPPEITWVVGHDRGLAVGRLHGILPREAIGLIDGVTAPAVTAIRIR